VKDNGKYENNVKSYLENLTTEISSFVDITKTLDNLNNILVKSADDAAPKIKKGKRRPKLQVMNDDIRIALTEKKAAFFKWKEMGRQTLNQIFFFSSTKIRIFFSATLGIRIFF
jgi:hypothetical protein